MLLLVGCRAAPAAPSAAPAAVVRPVSDVEWTALNPARGAASPRAATLWGERDSPGASGFLVAFADGFSSPPHIHNVTYRAVVISGAVHNDDPGAAPMWMAPGSFWTQPLGESHVTSARGLSTAYVEIDDGPYLVHPAAQAHEATEKPLNVDASNVVWAGSAVDGAGISRLWGQPDEGAGGAMIRLQPGATAQLEAEQAVRAIVVTGTPTVQAGGRSTGAAPGSLAAGTALALQCAASEAEPCVLYVRTAAGLTVSPQGGGRGR